MRYLFEIGRLLKKLSGAFLAFLFCIEHILLVLILSVAFCAGISFAYYKLQMSRDMCCEWAFAHLFDFSAACKSVAMGTLPEKVIACLLYCTTWLIGGGTLLAALVSRSSAFFARVRNGELRYTWCLRRHYVILGWDYNVISLLRQLLRDECLKGRDVVVLSDVPPVEIRRTVCEALGTGHFGRLPFRLVIYRGVYDSQGEFDKLALKYADRIYITGTQHESAHDVRVLALLSHLDKYLSRFKSSLNTDIVAKIDSHSLFRSLVRAVKKGPNKLRYLEKRVRFVNFYENWARYFWNADAVNCPQVDNRLARAYPPLRFRQDRDPVRLVIVGFGSMGQALLVQALRQATAESCVLPSQIGNNSREKTMVSIIDPDVDEAYDRFMQNYSDIVTEEYAKHCEVDEKVKLAATSRMFLEKISKISSDNAQVTVAVTFSDADKALDAAIMIHRVTKGRVNILVRTNIYVSDIEMCRANIAESYQLKNLYLFGFKDGAGYKR